MKKALKSVPSRSHEQATVESFRKDPEFSAEYLNSVLEDGDQEELMLALRRMSKAFGGVQKLAAKANLNANTLYPDAVPQRKSGTQEFKGCSASYGNAAHGPSIAKARRVKCHSRNSTSTRYPI